MRGMFSILLAVLVLMALTTTVIKVSADEAAPTQKQTEAAQPASDKAKPSSKRKGSETKGNLQTLLDWIDTKSWSELMLSIFVILIAIKLVFSSPLLSAAFSKYLGLSPPSPQTPQGPNGAIDNSGANQININMGNTTSGFGNNIQGDADKDSTISRLTDCLSQSSAEKSQIQRRLDAVESEREEFRTKWSEAVEAYSNIKELYHGKLRELEDLQATYDALKAPEVAKSLLERIEHLQAELRELRATMDGQRKLIASYKSKLETQRDRLLSYTELLKRHNIEDLKRD